MFEEERELVLEDTENVEEQTTEEIVEEETTPEPGTEEETVRTYTDDDVERIVGKRMARKEAKLRREFERTLAPYKEAERVLNAGLNTSNIEEATGQMRSFYEQKGVTIPNESPQYNEADTRVLANDEAQRIIDAGIDEVIEEVDRLADKGVENMTPREKLVFTQLAEYRKLEASRQELKEIGVKDDLIDSQDFKEFAAQFNPKTPITKVYELYNKTADKPQPAKIGSMKNGNTQEVKTFYTPEEVDKLTEKELDDPVIFRNVRNSMAKW